MTENENYELCGHPGCWHFITDNPAYGDYPGLAEYDHCDDGGKEHDHDATPGGGIRTLAQWRAVRPWLFRDYGDGHIGPNSPLCTIRIPLTKLQAEWLADLALSGSE